MYVTQQTRGESFLSFCLRGAFLYISFAQDLYIYWLDLYSMVVTTIRYRVGDTVPLTYVIEEYNISKETTDVFDLTGKTVTLDLFDESGTVPVIEDGFCTVVDADAGEIEYEWGSGETDVGGMYLAKFKVINSSGKIARFPEWENQYILMY